MTCLLLVVYRSLCCLQQAEAYPTSFAGHVLTQIASVKLGRQPAHTLYRHCKGNQVQFTRLDTVLWVVVSGSETPDCRLRVDQRNVRKLGLQLFFFLLNQVEGL